MYSSVAYFHPTHDKHKKAFYQVEHTVDAYHQVGVLRKTRR